MDILLKYSYDQSAAEKYRIFWRDSESGLKDVEWELRNDIVTKGRTEIFGSWAPWKPKIDFPFPRFVS